MKKAVNLLLALGLIAFFTSGVVAEEKTEGLEIWSNMGSLDSTVTFQESIPGTRVFNNEYDISGNTYVGFGVKYQFVNSNVERLSTSFQYLRASSLDGDTDDTTWQNGDFVNPSAGESLDTEAERDDFDFNLGWILFNSANEKAKINLLGGYFKTEYSFEERNVASVNAAMIGHIADYDLEMKSIYLGLEGNFLFVNDKLRINTSIKYIPELRAEATGTWDVAQRIFEQDAKGDGMIFDFGVSFVPGQNWSVGLNFSIQDLDTDGDAYSYGLSYVTDEYGNTTQIVSDDNFSYVTDIDEISIKSVDTELRIGYVF